MVNNETKTTLEFKVRNNAESKLVARKLCVPQAKERKAAHISVCQKLCELSDKNGQYPITYLVYFAVGKNAHRNEVFDEGYSKIDMTKAKTILTWLRMVANFNKNGKIFRNSNLAHALCKYYDTISKKTTDFEKIVSKIKANGNGKLGNFKEIVKAMGMSIEKDNTKEEKKTANKTHKSVSKAVSTKDSKTTKETKKKAVKTKEKTNKKAIKVTELKVAAEPSTANVEAAKVTAK